MNKEEINIEYFEKKFAEAKKEYDLLCEKISELDGAGADKPGDDEILSEAIHEIEDLRNIADKKKLKKSIEKLDKLTNWGSKRNKILIQQLSRDRMEMKFREKNGLPPLTKLRDIED